MRKEDSYLGEKYYSMKNPPQKPSLEMSWTGRMFRRLFFYFGSINVRLSEINRRRVLAETIETFKQEYEKADRYAHKDHKTLFNIGLYLLIIENDISALKFLMFNEIDDWPKRLVGRKFVILLYESSNDLSRLLGRDLRNIVKTLPERESLENELNDILKNLNEFKDKHLIYLSEVRNNCSAHRDKIAMNQLNAIDSIDINRLYQEIGAEFMVPIRKLNGSFMSNIMKAMVSKHKRDLSELLLKK